MRFRFVPTKANKPITFKVEKVLRKCLCGCRIMAGYYCSEDCKKERARLHKVLNTEKPKGYLQLHANDVLSKRWEMLWRVRPDLRDMMYKIERKLPLTIKAEEH